jgi:hypothetical protein
MAGSSKQSFAGRKAWLVRAVKIFLVVLVALVLADLYWLSTIWPDWG